MFRQKICWLVVFRVDLDAMEDFLGRLGVIGTRKVIRYIFNIE